MTDNLNVQDFPNLTPFFEDKNSEFLGYLLAYSHRRGVARNTAAKYGLGMAADPPFVSGADVDVVAYRNMLLKLEEVDRVSVEVYESLKEREIRAGLVIDELRTNKNLTVDQKHDLVVELEELEADIERMAAHLEELADG